MVGYQYNKSLLPLPVHPLFPGYSLPPHLIPVPTPRPRRPRRRLPNETPMERIRRVQDFFGANILLHGVVARKIAERDIQDMQDARLLLVPAVRRYAHGESCDEYAHPCPHGSPKRKRHWSGTCSDTTLDYDAHAVSRPCTAALKSRLLALGNETHCIMSVVKPSRCRIRKSHRHQANLSAAKFRGLITKFLPALARSALAREDKDDVLRAVIKKLPRRSRSKAKLYALSRDKEIRMSCRSFSAPCLARRLCRLAVRRKVNNSCISATLHKPVHEMTTMCSGRHRKIALDSVEQQVPTFLRVIADSRPACLSSSKMQSRRQCSPYALAKEMRIAAALERNSSEVTMTVDDHRMAFDRPSADATPLAAPAISTDDDMPNLALLSLSSYTDQLPDYEEVVDFEMTHWQSEVPAVVIENQNTYPVSIDEELQNTYSSEHLFPQQIVDDGFDDWRSQFLDTVPSTSHSEPHPIRNLVVTSGPSPSYGPIPTPQVVDPLTVHPINALFDMTNLASTVPAPERYRDLSQKLYNRRRRRIGMEDIAPITRTSVLDQNHTIYSKGSSSSRPSFSPYEWTARKRYLQKSGTEVTPSAHLGRRRIEKTTQKHENLTADQDPRETDGNVENHLNSEEKYEDHHLSHVDGTSFGNNIYPEEGAEAATDDRYGEDNGNPEILEIDTSLHPVPNLQFHADSPEVLAILADAMQSALTTVAVNDLADLFASLSPSAGPSDEADVILSEKNSDDKAPKEPTNGQLLDEPNPDKPDDKGTGGPTTDIGSNSKLRHGLKPSS